MYEHDVIAWFVDFVSEDVGRTHRGIVDKVIISLYLYVYVFAVWLMYTVPHYFVTILWVYPCLYDFVHVSDEVLYNLQILVDDEDVVINIEDVVYGYLGKLLYEVTYEPCTMCVQWPIIDEDLVDFSFHGSGIEVKDQKFLVVFVKEYVSQHHIV